MASLFNLLNPDYTAVRSQRLNDDYDSDPSSSACSDFDPEEEASSYYSRTRSKDTHEPHPDCPNTLDCLQDTDGRPPHTLPVILRCAILGSPDRRLTIREIYAAMENKYPYYRTAGPTWKQSVRHHLSLNRLFERQARPVTDPGFGSYWIVNLEAPPGTKRPRKRGRPKGPGGVPQPVRKRGRPKKDASQPASVALEASKGPCPKTRSETEKREYRCLEAVGGSKSVGETVPPDAGDTGGDTAAGTVSDDCDDSVVDEVIHPFDRPTLYPAQYYDWSQRAAPSPVFPLGNLEPSDDPFKQIERLRQELAEIKERTRDSNTLTQQLSDQLAHSQAESWRAKTALQTAESKLKETESKLKEEYKRRQDAERLAEEEVMRRRLLEDSVRESSKK